MRLRMNYIHHFLLILFPVIIIAPGGVHGRTLAQRRRPTTLTLMSQDGQLYNCVDFYKQPAFNHPLLKHLAPKIMSTNLTTLIQRKFNEEDGGCPNGSVPVINSGVIPPVPHPAEPQVHCYAVVRTVLDGRKFYGSNAVPAIYQPEVKGYQWSAARMKLMNGPDSIEAGWIVFPDYYKDNEAHLYARFITGSSGCFNLDCPGFVQVAQDLPLGSKPQGYSTIGGNQALWNISIDKHTDDGHWWFSMSWDNIGTRQIGYWPGSLFTGLKDAAAQVKWGGEINNPGAVGPAPAMGSSLKASYDLDKSAYFSHITVVDESFNKVEPHGTEKFWDCPRLYTVKDWGKDGGDNGRVIFYGGSQGQPDM